MQVVCVIATNGKRKKQLKKAVDSLSFQAPVLVYDNSKNKDLTDNAKFLYIDAFNEPVYYLSCDDDLIYPENYVEVMVENIEKYGIVTCHGRVLKPDRKKYYKSDHEEFDFRHENKKARLIDVAGTGCTGFRTDFFAPDIALSEYKRMSDLVFSLEAWKQGKTITYIEKPRDWIKSQPTEDSIFKSESRGEQIQQVDLMNKIIDLKFKEFSYGG
jgi:hypothetical protein